jgi:hypothetical protein
MWLYKLSSKRLIRKLHSRKFKIIDILPLPELDLTLLCRLFRAASEASDIKEILVHGSGTKRKSTTDTHSNGNKSPASQKRRKGIEAVNTSASTSTPESSSGDDDDDDALNPLPSTPELERYFQSIRKLHYSAKMEASDRTKQTILHQTRRITSLKKQLKAAEYEAQVHQVKREDAEAELKELKEKIKRFMKGLGV